MAAAELSQVAYVAELLLLLGGLWLLWSRHLRPSLRGEAPPARITPWEAGVLDLGLLLWVVLCGGFVVQLLGMSLLGAKDLSEARTQIAAGACFQVGMLVSCLVFTRSNAAGRRFDLPRTGGLGAGATGFLCVLPLMFGTGFLWHQLLRSLGVPVEQQELIDLFRNTSEWTALSLMVLMAVVVAPLTEELIFRAGLFRFMRSRTPRWVALLVPALLFGLLHLNLASFPQLVLLGVLLSLLYERSGNIAVPMLAHGLFNLNTILLVLAGVDA